MDRLIPVASYVNVAEADLAQVHLSSHGIPSFLSNATLVAWYWHYSNATGNVQVWVKPSQVKRARWLLFPQPNPNGIHRAPWNCPHCSAEIDGGWSVCWSCGSTRNGQRNAEFQLASAARGESDPQRLFSAKLFLLILIFYLLSPLVFLGSIGFLGVFFAMILFWRLLFPYSFSDSASEITSKVQPQDIPVESISDSACPAEFTPAEDRIERALRTAFLGVLSPIIPSLLLSLPLMLAFEFYAVLLLYQAIPEWNALSKNSRHRFILTWLFVFLAFLFYILPIGGINLYSAFSQRY